MSSSGSIVSALRRRGVRHGRPPRSGSSGEIPARRYPHEGEPGVRYSSGLTVCDEALRDGHWINRYWLATGMVKPEFHLNGERRSRVAPLADAFELSMEGQDLAGTWKWVKAYQEQVRTPSQGLLVTVELESAARPVASR